MRRLPLVVIAALLGLPAAAQLPVSGSGTLLGPLNLQPGPSSAYNSGADQQSFTIRKRVDEVSLIFTVLDKHGKPVRDLGRRDIAVLDNQRPPDAVTQFQSSMNMPLRVGILLDVSGSVRDRFHFEQAAAVEFLRRAIRPQTDQAFLMRFQSSAQVAQDFTSNTEQLARAVYSLRNGGGSAVYDAIYRACRDKLMNVDEGSADVHRAIILISDGEDNQSQHGREEALEVAMRANVTIYAISTNISGVVTRGDRVLKRFAEMTGGRVFFPSKGSEVTEAFTSIEQELRSQYFLAYRPADFTADGRYHRIELAVLGNRNYTVRNRQGYYAPRN